MKNAYSINIIFLLLTLVGLLHIPRLPVQLFPQKQGKSLQVGFEWRGMAAEPILFPTTHKYLFLPKL
jgi:multidrug efflux pump subunit AcrB